MLIDATYFIGQISIAQRNDLAVQENLDWFIEKYEPKILNMLLGKEFNALFQAGLLEDPIAARWSELRDVSNLKDLIANYVYFWYMQNEASQTTGMGEVQATTENGVKISPNQKMVRAWNEMVNWCLDLDKFLNDNTDTYPEWESTYVRDSETCRYPEIYLKQNTLGL